MSYYIGIDPGSRLLGWSVLRVAKTGRIYLVDSGTLHIRDNSSDIGDRLSYINLFLRDKITDTTKKGYINQVFLEDYLVHASRGAKAIPYVQGIVHLVCAETLPNDAQSIDISMISPKRVKKVVTGNGNASKEEVAASIRKIFPKIRKKSHVEQDEYDAIAIAVTGIRDARSQTS